MTTAPRVFGLALAAVAAAWTGAAFPLAAFLLTGLPLVPAAGGVFILSGLVAAFGRARGRTVRTILLTVAGGAVAGAVAQGAFSFAGGWSFGD